jgi:hypothetical protein
MWSVSSGRRANTQGGHWKGSPAELLELLATLPDDAGEQAVWRVLIRLGGRAGARGSGNGSPAARLLEARSGLPALLLERRARRLKPCAVV